MSDANDDLYNAGRLIQYALQPAVVPERCEEYSDLIELYLDRLDFQATVRRIADGLGLLILGEPRRNWSLILAPKPESVFSTGAREYRSSSNYTPDRRLLDGLIHVAVAATVYPRDADLFEDSSLRNNNRAVTVDEVETMLRRIAERLEEVNKTNPDPAAGAEGLYEAWRVYKNCPATKETKSRRGATWTTRNMIEKALEYLCERRCFRKEGANYEPLPRYQTLVREYAATQIYRAVKRALGADEETI